MSAISVLMLNVTGITLLVVGFLMQARNRSPYSGIPMDETAKKRVGTGWWVGILGCLCIGVAQVVRVWR